MREVRPPPGPAPEHRGEHPAEAAAEHGDAVTPTYAVHSCPRNASAVSVDVGFVIYKLSFTNKGGDKTLFIRNNILDISRYLSPFIAKIMPPIYSLSLSFNSTLIVEPATKFRKSLSIFGSADEKLSGAISKLGSRQQFLCD